MISTYGPRHHALVSIDKKSLDFAQSNSTIHNEEQGRFRFHCQPKRAINTIHNLEKVHQLEIDREAIMQAKRGIIISEHNAHQSSYSFAWE